jgi:hypothetical protein
MADSIAQVLVRSGKLSAERMARAQQETERSGRPLPEMLVRLGYCAETDIQRAFAESLGLPIVDSSARPEPEALALISAELAQKHMVVPIRRENGHVVVALSDPMNLTALDDVRLATGLHVQPAYADRELIERYITDSYAGAEDGDGDIEVVQEEGDNVAELQRLAREALVVRLVNNIFREAVRGRASDIHIEAFEDRAQVRYRIDGVLQEQMPPPQRLMPAIVSRVKILADLDIAERRLPQDGRIKTHIMGKEIDIRVSTLPTLHGEAVVMRLLDQSNIQLSLEDIGFTELQLQVYEKSINRPYGMVLVTGPTGSGKTTTLYASLRRIFTPEKKIITVEDPVEYQMSGVNQMQVRERIGLTFGRGLRAIVRQDPDIIMVGEIRDKDDGDRRPRGAHRPPPALHAAHQRRSRRRLPPHRYGAGTVPRRQLAGMCDGPAPRPARLPGMPGGAGAAARDDADHGEGAGLRATRQAVAGRGLQQLPLHRVRRAARAVRDPAGHGRRAPVDPGRTVRRPDQSRSR